MVHGENRIPYRIDRRLSGLAGPDYDATISFGLPLEPEDSQYGKSTLRLFGEIWDTAPGPVWRGVRGMRSCVHGSILAHPFVALQGRLAPFNTLC